MKALEVESAGRSGIFLAAYVPKEAGRKVWLNHSRRTQTLLKDKQSSKASIHFSCSLVSVMFGGAKNQLSPLYRFSSMGPHEHTAVPVLKKKQQSFNKKRNVYLFSPISLTVLNLSLSTGAL